MGPTLRANLLSTGATHGARIPIAPNGVLHGVVTVSARGMAIYEELFERAVSLGHIVEMALSNALTLEQSEREATTDPLTGLADRRGFDFEVVRLRGGRPFAVLALDVDDLKQVNGNLGHATSDARLVATAQVMTRVMRWGDLVARVGDDEFAAFLVHPSEEGPRRTAQRILAALKLTQIDGVNPAVSLGSPVAPLPRTWRRSSRRPIPPWASPNGRAAIPTCSRSPVSPPKSRVGSRLDFWIPSLPVCCAPGDPQPASQGAVPQPGGSASGRPGGRDAAR